jgi:hypothetical protein
VEVVNAVADVVVAVVLDVVDSIIRESPVFQKKKKVFFLI